jgi:glucose-6-phosphate isomerase
MLPSSSRLTLHLHNHHTDRHYETLVRQDVLERARKLVRRAREKGLGSLRRSTDPLVGIGMETNSRGRVTKNSLGVLDLSWQAAERPDWPDLVQEEIGAIRRAVRAAHGAELENLIWVGMGGSSEDKAMYDALGLLNGGVQVYILDSTDPAKLQAILRELGRRRPLGQALRRTLVVAMAMGMTSYEPVINLEKLHLLYRKNRVPSESNFLYMTLPGSLLDRFAGPRGYRRIELQLDGDNTVAGRHSGPLTRGSLYPLALNGVDLRAWMAAAVLSDDEIHGALRMAAFLHGNGLDSREQVCLLLPEQWRGAGIWTKQDFEESLGKSEGLGIKIFPCAGQWPPARLPARDPAQDRVFWAVNVEGCAGPDPALGKVLRQQGYPLATLSLSGPMVLPRYMQWIHYVVFGMGCLRQMNFVTQPSVELYKSITAKVHERARRAGGVERTRPWQDLVRSRYRAAAPGGVTLYYDSLVRAGLLSPADLAGAREGAAEVLARAVARLRERNRVAYVELTYYGDTRYLPQGRRLRQVLETVAARAFLERLGLCSDVYEGPAMNHSYHEMIIGHGRCFSIVILSRKQASLPALDYRPDYHKAQWLATKLALEQRGRAVVALTIPDGTAAAVKALASLFRQMARRLPAPPVLR